MRAMLYDLLTTDPVLQAAMGVTYEELQERVTPRRAQENNDIPKPFAVYGLGNSTNEGLTDSTAKNPDGAERQFFQVWIHDEGGDYTQIDNLVEIVKKRLTGQGNPAYRVITIQYLETSQEFSNETYGTLFRYIRFQAIKAKVVTPS